MHFNRTWVLQICGRVASQDRRPSKNSSTTNAKKNYLPDDERDFGRPVPVPCLAFEVRITLPNIIHGSTNKTERQRRVIFPWHTSIQPDHTTLERPGQLTWEEVSRCHRDHQAPIRGVGGDLVSRDRPPYPFPAALSMNSSSALCDALIGRRRWDDPMVSMEKGMLLGTDDNAALTYVTRTRERLVENFLSAMGYVEYIERNSFGQNSYFEQIDAKNKDVKLVSSTEI
jgi:hypothetical protein